MKMDRLLYVISVVAVATMVMTPEVTAVAPIVTLSAPSVLDPESGAMPAVLTVALSLHAPDALARTIQGVIEDPALPPVEPTVSGEAALHAANASLILA